jgi:hypothetical protein
MKQLLTYILTLIITLPVIGQTDKEFEQLIEHFKKNNYTHDTISSTSIHNGKSFTINLSKTPLDLNIKELTIENPYEGNPFPLSYSVIYRDNLFTLFEPGKFVCHDLSTYKRNLDLEKILNTKKFFYAWIIGDKLVAKSGLDYFYFTDDNSWEKYSKPVPLSNKNIPFESKPKLFEDEKYIVYMMCKGEWGGTIFFYNKSTGKTYETGATCANSVIKKDEKYYVLSHLGHMSGTADIQIIENPESLSASRNSKTLFDYYNIQIFSSFELDETTYYMVNWRDATFLATIKNDTISIVNPLFNNDLYTHDPITQSYGDNLTLMNLDFYGKGKEREVSCIIIRGNDLAKINWKE